MLHGAVQRMLTWLLRFIEDGQRLAFAQGVLLEVVGNDRLAQFQRRTIQELGMVLIVLIACDHACFECFVQFVAVQDFYPP